MNWLVSNRTIPVFADSALETASVIHVEGCRSGANEDGHARATLCTNRFCVQHQLQQGVAVLEVHRTETSLLVRTQTSSPFWIEEGTTVPCRAPKTQDRVRSSRQHTILLPPPDYLLVDAWIGNGSTKLPRRRRPIRGGEIVFLRSELNEKRDPEIWRFFALSFHNSRKIALIIDASIPFDSALNPGWRQCRPVLLEHQDGLQVQPEQLLIPVFPLPDGTQDPGWRSTPMG